MYSGKKCSFIGAILRGKKRIHDKKLTESVESKDFKAFLKNCKIEKIEILGFVTVL